MSALIVFFSTILSGCIQGCTGFGSGIVLILILPAIYSLSVSAGLSGLVTMFSYILPIVSFHKKVNMKNVVIPALFNCLFSTIGIHVGLVADKRILLSVLGIFLVCLSVYFLCFPRGFAIKPNFRNAAACGMISGILNGLFSTGGPPMAIYYLCTTHGDKEEYLGSISSYFLITGSYAAVCRISQGVFSSDIVLPFLIGSVGIFLGSALGKFVAGKLDMTILKKIVYVFIGFSGAVNVCKAFI